MNEHQRRPVVASSDDALGTCVDLPRRRMNTMLLMAALSLPRAALGEQAPEASPYRVIDFDWTDPARSRAVPARLYWPAVAATTPVPLVVFSHGIGGSRNGYSYLGKNWSAHGVASLHVQHVGSDAALWRGNPFGVVDRLQTAARESEALARVADVSFALDRLLSREFSDFGMVVNRRRIVAAGHSYGANTSLLAIGAEVIRDGQALHCLDPRFSAAVVISAPPFYGEQNLAAILAKISVPTIHVTSTHDVIRIPGYYSGLEDRLAVFDAIAAPRKLLAVFEGGSHSMFTDRRNTGGPTTNARVKAATADLTLAFFDWIFESDGTVLARWQDRWRFLLARAPSFKSPSLPHFGVADQETGTSRQRWR